MKLFNKLEKHYSKRLLDGFRLYVRTVYLDCSKPPKLTVELTFLSLFFGIFVGIFFAVLRTSRNTNFFITYLIIILTYLEEHHY